MANRNGDPVSSAVGSGLTRPILAYVAVVSIGTWGLYALEDVRRGGDPLGTPVAAVFAFLGSGLLLPGLVAVLDIPAMVLTIELVHRFRPASVGARSVAGALAWTGWGLFVAITLVVASRLVLVPEVLAGDLLLVAVAGAAFSVLAFDGHDVRSGMGLTLLALVDAASVVIASAWMAGRWGGSV